MRGCLREPGTAARKAHLRSAQPADRGAFRSAQRTMLIGKLRIATTVALTLLRYHVLRLCLRKVVSMATPAPTPIPTEPIGSIPRPVDLIERIAKGDSEDPNRAPLYEDAIRDTIERF